MLGLPSSTPSYLRFLVWFILAALIHYLNVRMPMIGDDYLFSIVYEYQEASSLSERYTSQLIKTVPQFLHSCWQHYLGTNGCFSDVLGSFFLTLGGGKDVFNVLNTAVFLLFIGISTRYFFRKISPASLLCAAGVVLLCIPTPEGTLLWTMGSVNYLWGSLLRIGTICYIRQLQQQEPSAGCQIAGCLCAFFAARIHEGLAMPLVAACFAVLVFCRQSRTRAFVLLTLLASLGTMVTLASPGIWKRAVSNGILANIISSLMGFIRHSVCPAVVLGCLLLVHRKKILGGFKKPRLEPFFLGSFLVFLVGITVLYGSKGIWGGAYYYMNMAMAFLILSFLGTSWLTQGRAFRAVLGGIGALLFLVSYIQLLQDTQFCQDVRQQALVQAKAGQTVCVVTCPNYYNNFLAQRLPCNIPNLAYCRSAAAVEKVQPYYLVMQRPGIDPSAYSCFSGRSVDTLQTSVIGTSVFVRMPQGIFPLAVTKGNRQRIPEGTDSLHRHVFRRLIRSIVPREEPPSYNRDYMDGFHYLVFPAKAFSHATLTVTGIHEKTMEKCVFTLNLP